MGPNLNGNRRRWAEDRSAPRKMNSKMGTARLMSMIGTIDDSRLAEPVLIRLIEVRTGLRN